MCPWWLLRLLCWEGFWGPVICKQFSVLWEYRKWEFKKHACQGFICSPCQEWFILHRNYLSTENVEELAFKTFYLVRLLGIIVSHCNPFFSNFLAFTAFEIVVVIYIFLEIYSFHWEFDPYLHRTECNFLKMSSIWLYFLFSYSCIIFIFWLNI